MSVLPGFGQRDVIPRWRPTAAALRSGELNSFESRSELLESRAAKTDKPVNREQMAKLFAESPGVFTAGDLLNQADANGFRSATTENAAFLLLQDPSTPSLARLLAKRHIDGQVQSSLEQFPPDISDERLRERVRLMRNIVRNEPRNALKWADLALAHANLGDKGAAVKEIEIARNLAPNSRHILRSAARLFVLNGEAERAHHVLLRSSRLEVDPWLQAAEISVASIADLHPRSVRVGKKIVRANRLRPWHLSELSSELATLELRAGNLKQARQLLRISLIEPTENALAQAEWSAVHGVKEAVLHAGQFQRSFEAQALSLAHTGEFEAALQNALLWQADQPFAPEPAVFASYLASSGLESFDLAVAIARRGLETNPDELVLRNNLAFALILNGEHEEGASQIRMLLARAGERAGLERGTILATAGLLAFRVGMTEQGRKYYEQSSSVVNRRNDPRARALLQLFWAREELLADSEMANKIFMDAEERASVIDSDAVVRAVRDRVRVIQRSRLRDPQS